MGEGGNTGIALLILLVLFELRLLRQVLGAPAVPEPRFVVNSALLQRERGIYIYIYIYIYICIHIYVCMYICTYINIYT